MKKVKRPIFVMLFSALFLMLVGMTSCSKEKDCVQTDPAENCICTLEYDPVCGCDGVLYGNSCSAECNGIFTYTSGICN